MMGFAIAAPFQRLQRVPEQHLGAVSAGSARTGLESQTLSAPLLPGSA